MGFIQAFAGALSGTFADQWKDFLMPRQSVSPTAGIFQAVPYGTNAGRGENTKGSANIITNGSRVVVPEGTALVCMQDGAITALVMQPGGYIWNSADPNSRSVFAPEGGIIAPTLGTSWERFKFGGQPGSQQLVFYVNLKEIPNNRFGTQAPIYWNDRYLNAKAGAICRGSYTLRIVDPILFIKQYVPQQYLLADAPEFDFADLDNPAIDQLFTEVVSTLGQAFSRYSADPAKGQIENIQGDQVGFAQSLGQAIEEEYHWQQDRGITIMKVAIAAIEYDEPTLALLGDVQKADALSGGRGNAFMQQSIARGMQAAGENPDGGGAMGMAFMGMGMNAAGAMAGGVQQPNEQQPNPFMPAQQPQPQPQAQPVAQTPADGMFATGAQPAATPDGAGDDPVAKLAQYKQMLDQGLITEDDYNAAKAKVLGL